MLTSHSFQLDPHAILGVGPEATLEQIRDAYRTKSKRHHPDVGGDEWAFRVIHQSYEILSRARVGVRATPAAEPARPAAPTPAEDPTTPRRRRSDHSPPSASSNGETVRPGFRDKVADAALVDVEILRLRYEAEHLWLFRAGTVEDRTLSSSLNISWPSASTSGLNGVDSSRVLPRLDAALKVVAGTTEATTIRSRMEDGKFSGWASYATVEEAWAGFRALREALKVGDLGVRQWSRDIVIPRESR